MRVRFTKMHGCGNDYIYLDCRQSDPPADIAVLSRTLSRRHFAVGADGVIYICAPDRPGADAAMRMYNTDGSEGRMCGNGIRCAAEYLYTHGLPKRVLRIGTAAGQKVLRRQGRGLWQVEMGRFSARAADVPAVGLGKGPLLRVPLAVGGARYEVSVLSMGNPHCVVLWPGPGPLPRGAALAALGPGFEKHPAFPAGVNTEFVTVHSDTALEMTVWERGSGATLACGTGACAAAAAMVLRGLCRRGAPIAVTLPGGTLTVRVQPDDTVLLTGPAQTAFHGWAEV